VVGEKAHPEGFEVDLVGRPRLELLRPDHAAALLADQEAGGGAYFLVVADAGTVLGRVNLIFTDGGRAVLGYRVGERSAGRGVATTAVEQVCGLARSSYGVREVVADTSDENVASQRVLAKAGFEPAGPADPAHIGGKQGSRWRRDLAG
jgi:ribosomal-protein-alanine N-acetyltransferase